MHGTVDPQQALLDADNLCGHLLEEGSIYRSLATLGDQLFSDADFADMYDPACGRYSVPPSLLAKVSLLQALESLSDRDAVKHVKCDLQWKVALHLAVDDQGFHYSVLSYFRERMRRSDRPKRVFERFKQVAEEAGLLSKKGARVLDSTPILSAVQTEDTVTMIRGGLRRLLALLAKTDREARDEILASLRRDDYGRPGKPIIDWDDEAARSQLVDELVKDAIGVLAVLEGRELDVQARSVADTLATVAGQDVEQDESTGRFRIRRGVAEDRVISTVDPEARHGRKSSHGPFDGFKAHVAVEPEHELITHVAVTPANVADGDVALQLLPELQSEDAEITTFGDTHYGSGDTRAALMEAGATVVAKAPPAGNSWGGFPKSMFEIDLEQGTATCPNGLTVGWQAQGGGRALFRFPAAACNACPVRAQCTTSSHGRIVTVGPHEALLAEARAFQQTNEFKHLYNGTRPVVERVIYRVVRRGGRKARFRGVERICEQVEARAAVENFRRMMRLGLHWTGPGGWAVSAGDAERATCRRVGRTHFLGRLLRRNQTGIPANWATVGPRIQPSATPAWRLSTRS